MSIARVSVALKPGGRGTGSDRERAFRIMLAEFRRRVSDAGILHEIKERQYFESKSEKLRKKKKDALNKRKTEEIEEKLRSGIKVEGEAKLVKKITKRLNAKKNKKNDFTRKKRDY